MPPAIARTKQVLPNVKQLLLDSPSALFLAVKTGRATAFSIDKPIADFYAAENEDLMRVDTTGTRVRLCQQGLDLPEAGRLQVVAVPRHLGAANCASAPAMSSTSRGTSKWLHKDPPPQRLYDFNKH